VFVLDASAALAWFFEDEATADSTSLLRMIGENQPVAPSVFPLEMANTLLMAERKQRVTPAQFESYVGRLSRLNIEIEAQSETLVIGGVLPLARKHALSSYDASYLELAVRRSLPLASRDERLKRAARSCGIELLPA
jgi:predicted nucleic acid-binding protein